MPTTKTPTTPARKRTENVIPFPRSPTTMEHELICAARINAIIEAWEAYYASIPLSSASILPFAPRSAIAPAALVGGA